MPPSPQKRAADRAQAQAWARALLQRDDWLLLDTNTTEIWEWGDLVEVAVLRPDGTVAFESLVKPLPDTVQDEFPAADRHGITRAVVADAPSFTEIEPCLRELLHGRTVMAYSADYNRNILCIEVDQMYLSASGPLQAPRSEDDHHVLSSEENSAWLQASAAQADAWVAAVNWECAMKQYAQFAGEWSVRYQAYEVIALGSGHRAVDNCRACLERIKEMAP